MKRCHACENVFFQAEKRRKEECDVLNLKLFYVIWRGSSDDDAESYDLPGSQMLNSHIEMNSVPFCGIKIRTYKR